MFSSWGLLARENILISLQRLNVKNSSLNSFAIIFHYSKRSLIHSSLHKHNSKFFNSQWFEQWLVGFIDGNGIFTIDRLNKGEKWVLVFKISQHHTNAQILYYIKSQLLVGHIRKSKDGNWSFRICDRKQFE